MYKHEILFQDYLELRSKQSKEHIAGFQKYNEPDRDISIKVNLDNGNSIIVYYNGDNIDCKTEVYPLSHF
ncbi:hypothetical protein LGK95_13460 [Clostridium algoriphilum]|uniref:hypothetical protein n=1 Tax=Clostridium algoriphilum TaxID=198347 RepID=UPI001CF4C544|nr:hypothetical protein [Clostridium algoriphilum]MCB2294516.1 hypothetical protein [Clostridium algoriphilum]